MKAPRSAVRIVLGLGLASLFVGSGEVCLAAQALTAPSALRVYLGTYTGGRSQGIYLAELDLSQGRLTPPTLAANARNPSFLALHPSGRFVYAVSEVSDYEGRRSGAVSAFRIQAQTGKLRLLNQQPSGGGAPCHLVVDRRGKNLLVANYGGGSVTVFPLDTDGRLKPASCRVQHHGSSVHPSRQTAPHAHGVYLDESDHFAFIPDLGLDQVVLYRFDAEAGTLEANDTAFVKLPPGAGPRHLTFHPNGQFAYVINELNSTVTGLTADSDRGTLNAFQTVSTLPDDYDQPSTTAEIAVHPSGKFLYGSNRGHDSLAVFAIDLNTGRLKRVEQVSTQGRTPRHFAIEPSGKYLLAANQASDRVVVFRVDPVTGVPTPTGSHIEVGSPVCVLFASPQLGNREP